MPLLYTIVKEGSVFNWSSILSLTIMDAIARVRYHTPGNPPEFYMSSYLIDIVCAANHFPGMGWKWAPTEPPVQVYCQDLWEHKYIRHYTRICDHFRAPLYTMILSKPAPRLRVREPRWKICPGTPQNEVFIYKIRRILGRF